MSLDGGETCRMDANSGVQRHDIDIVLLNPDAIRNVVDKLLSIFCIGPP